MSQGYAQNLVQLAGDVTGLSSQTVVEFIDNALTGFSVDLSAGGTITLTSNQYTHTRLSIASARLPSDTTIVFPNINNFWTVDFSQLDLRGNNLFVQSGSSSPINVSTSGGFFDISTNGVNNAIVMVSAPPSGFTAGTDLAGTSTSQTLVGITGNPVNTTFFRQTGFNRSAVLVNIDSTHPLYLESVGDSFTSSSSHAFGSIISQQIVPSNIGSSIFNTPTSLLLNIGYAGPSTSNGDAENGVSIVHNSTIPYSGNFTDNNNAAGVLSWASQSSTFGGGGGETIIYQGSNNFGSNFGCCIDLYSNNNLSTPSVINISATGTNSSINIGHAFTTNVGNVLDTAQNVGQLWGAANNGFGATAWSMTGQNTVDNVYLTSNLGVSAAPGSSLAFAFAVVTVPITGGTDTLNPSQYNCVKIALTGTLGSAENLVFPNINGFFYLDISGLTLGVNTLTLQAGSGTVDVTTLAGTTSLIFVSTNGSNGILAK